MATGLLSKPPTSFSTMAKPYNGPAINVKPLTVTSNTSGLTANGSGAANNAANASLNTTKPLLPSLGITAKTPATKAPVTTLPKNQVNTTPKPTVQATTDGGTNSTGGTGVLKAPNDPGNKYDTSTGQLNPNYKDPNVTNVTGQPAPQNLDLYGSLINNAVQSTANNKGITDKAQGYLDNAAQNIQTLRGGAATNEQAYQTGMIAPRAQGLAQNTAQTEAAQEGAIQAGVTNELTGTQQALAGQGQTQSGLLGAAGLAAPNGNIINVDPTTGLPVAGGSLGQLAQTAGTVAGIQSGAAATAAAGGNIAAQNATALGTASTGANAQSISNFTTKINTTQNSMATINSLANGIVPNMTATGFNPTTSPIGNQTFAQYFTEKDPAAKQGLVQGLAEIKNQVSNVIASSTGLTPSGVTAALGDIDFTSLNPQQLHDFLGYIDSYAQTNIQAAQQSIQTIQNGGAVSANPAPLPVPTPNSTGQAAAGTGATLAAGLIGKIVSEAGNAAAGAIGGIASSILK